MTEKYILVSLEDEKVQKIAEILGNKTSKKILDFLAEKDEASETDISRELGIPINTVEYNINKLLNAGLVEKAKNYFWSIKGKKIDMYKLAKKHIVISHKSSKPSLSKLKTLVPVVILTGIFVFLIKFLVSPQQTFEAAPEMMLDEAVATGAAKAVESAGNVVSFSDKLLALPGWSWFLLGALIVIILMTLLNWRKL